MRHLNCAAGWQHHRDPNVQRSARALVKTVCHGHTPFDELVNRAKKLRGVVNKAGKAHNDRKAIEGCEPLSLALPCGYSVERLHTVAKLARAGRTLGNCAKDNGEGMHDALRHRKADFYLVRRKTEPVAMLDADLATDRVTQFLGPSNDQVALPPFVLCSLLRQLRLDGDDVDAFLQVGAASIFASGQAHVLKPSFQRGGLRSGLRIWWARRRLVVVVAQGGSWSWSSFRWDGAEAGWVSSRASRRERLDDLMTRYPDIAGLAHKAARGGARRPKKARRP